MYAVEKSLIEYSIDRKDLIKISHYGSTSIPGIIAKPTIDILLEVARDIDKDKLIRQFRDMGYLYDSQPNDPPPNIMFMKGYTPEGFSGQAYHVHVRYSGDWDELYFRDYLILHPDLAEQYATLKINLWKKYEFDREAYTYGKTDFIKMVTQQARKELGEKN